MMKVGPSFIDAIHTEKPSRLSRNNYRDFGDGPSMRPSFFLIILFVGILVLGGRLFWMQIIQGDYYRTISDSNRIRTITIHAPRGVIFDRNGKPLVYNTPGYREIVNGKLKLLDQTQAIPLLAKGDTHLEIDSLRNYPYKDVFAHVVGYIGQISQDELKLPQYVTYNSGDTVGKMGVEQSYESVLKGLDGKVLIEVDATGKELRVLGQTDPIPGQNLKLTLDENIQNAAYNAMKAIKKGSAIVSKPDGEILAMVSSPSFDPNLFTMGTDYKPNAEDTYQTIGQVLTDGDGQPVLNRVISGTYPPGSTFKLLTASAALEDHVIDQSFTIEDTGILHVGNFSFANWYYTDNGKTDGIVDVVKAIKRSNDIFFYKVGQMVGVDKLSAYAAKFGLGKKLGIDLRGEASGFLPTKEWKEKVIGDKWYLGDDYHYGIGQGYLLTTPLQVNAWTQAIANGGTLYLPHIAMTSRPIIKADHLISSTTHDLVREGMIEACSPGGVGYPFFNFTAKSPRLAINGQDILEAPQATTSADFGDYRQIVVACKTGTAQQGGDASLPHAWITLFAPAYHPEVVVTVLAESSGEGSVVAGPVAAQILRSYFEGK